MVAYMVAYMVAQGVIMECKVALNIHQPSHTSMMHPYQSSWDSCADGTAPSTVVANTHSPRTPPCL